MTNILPFLLLLSVSPLLIQSAFIQNCHSFSDLVITTTATPKKNNGNHYTHVKNFHPFKISRRLHTNNKKLANFSLNMAASDASVKVTKPSSDAVAEMGMTEWPQQTKTASFEETSAFGEIMVRYVLAGSGSLDIRERATNEAAAIVRKRKEKVEPGTLVEVSGEASLTWNVDDEMIILTPGFEEGGKFLAVAAIFIILLGFLFTRW